MNVRGIGVDIIEVGRVRRAVERRREGFRRRVFTPGEWDYCFGHGKENYASLAARFAAKEAVFKALGWGWREIAWREIEVVRGPGGEPQIYLGPLAKAKAGEQEVVTVLVSISHTKEYAVAQAVALGGEE